MIIVCSYLVYLGITLAVTIWVGSTLYKNGKAFLVDAFHGNDALAESVNHLLVVGFYLVNVGYVCMVLKMSHPPTSLATAMELLSQKLGMVFIILGGMHFFNIYLFNRYRKSALYEAAAHPAKSVCSLEATR